MLSLIQNDMFDDRKQENKMQMLIMKNGHIILVYNGKFKTLESHDTFRGWGQNAKRHSHTLGGTSLNLSY